MPLLLLNMISFPLGTYSTNDMALVDCPSMRSLDGSSTLGCNGFYMDYYAYCIPQHTMLAPQNLAT